MKKVAVFGVGHLGKIHANCVKSACNAELVGIYDINVEHCREVAAELGTKAYEDADELLEQCEVADVVTATTAHYEMAKRAMLKGKHVFIEKPVTALLRDAEELLDLQKKTGLQVQVGHVERFNPAFVATKPYITNPMFIEAHRLALFNPRGNDVSVVLDLMIHDIDVILKIVDSEIRNIHASGVAIVTDSFDIANVRIEFENGCVANLTASRISLKNMRKTRIFQPNAYISVDFLEKKSDIIHIEDVGNENSNPFAMILDLGEGKAKKQIIIKSPEIHQTNAIQTEIESFVSAIENGTIPEVTLYDGYNALKTANLIIDKMNETIKLC
ncbi:MAG: Gfo/Idh/MocA family oxidoreductase [Bacteroidales bacterium]|nr:Gfo/Idh/MocA family oxidoreductase [Bacteroidales bacterium]